MSKRDSLIWYGEGDGYTTTYTGRYENQGGWSTTYHQGMPLVPDDYEATKNKSIKNLPKGVSLMELWKFIAVYGEDRKKPKILAEKYGFGENEEEAKIKSGIMKDVDETIDMDFFTIISEQLGSVKVKDRPTEVKAL